MRQKNVRWIHIPWQMIKNVPMSQETPTYQILVKNRSQTPGQEGEVNTPVIRAGNRVRDGGQ